MAALARSRRPSVRERRGARQQPPRPPAAVGPSFDRAAQLICGVVVLAAAVVYWLTAARDIVVGDTAELAAAAIAVGVAHPPGYPLLMLLGHALGDLPAGPLPFRLNLLAVACDAAAVGVVYLTAYRLVGDRVAAGLAALLLAFTPLFWTWSLAFEAFPLNNLLAAGLVYFVVRWHEEPERWLPLVGAALLAGFGLANHQTIVLLGPAVLYLLWRRRDVLRARPVIVLAGAAALVVGLLPYAYVPFAAAGQPYWNWGGVQSFGDLLALMTRQTYGTAQLATGVFQGGSPLDRIVAFATSFTPPEGALIVLGWVAAYRLRRWYALFAALAFVFVGPVFVGFANINLATPGARFILERFFLLGHVVAAPMIAFGFVRALEILEGSLGGRTHPLPNPPPSKGRGLFPFSPGEGRLGWGGPLATTQVVLAAILLAFIAWTIGSSYARIDQSQNLIARTFGEDVLASLPQDGVLLVNGDETVFPVGYLQAVENHRPDVTMVMMGLLSNDWYVRQLQAPRRRLQVPFARLDGRTGTLASLVAANPGRQFALVGPTVDDSIRQGYLVYGPGLVGEIHPSGAALPLAQLVDDAERLSRLYSPPTLAEVKPGTFERGILTQYAAGPFRVGSELERAGVRDAARAWYQRALAIDPELSQARDGLARVSS
jgi:hypothetical protein